jgi:hypothetical protein
MTENTQNKSFRQNAKPVADAELNHVSGGAVTNATTTILETNYVCPKCSGAIATGITNKVTGTTMQAVTTFYCMGTCKATYSNSADLKKVEVRLTIDGDRHSVSADF